MKHLVLMMTLALATTAYAQPKKNTQPAAQPVQTYSAPSTKIIGGNFGMRQGAFNVGFSIDSGSNTGDLGGSFFMQTEKEADNSIMVNQVMTFGAHVVLNVFDSNGWVLDLRPGINVTMISDIPTATGKDDKTVFGPALRWSVAHRLASGSEFGIERLEVWNWFEDSAPSESAYTSLVFRTRF